LFCSGGSGASPASMSASAEPSPSFSHIRGARNPQHLPCLWVSLTRMSTPPCLRVSLTSISHHWGHHHSVWRSQRSASRLG
jgi:hypothetical protein